MKYLVIIFYLFALSNFSTAQIWKNSINFEINTHSKENNLASVTITANITKGWHVFSKTHDSSKADGIGLPVIMTVTGKGIKTEGTFIEKPMAIPHKDEFGISQVLENTATFTQNIKIKQSNVSGIAILEGQVCSDEAGCYPFKKEFEFTINQSLK